MFQLPTTPLATLAAAALLAPCTLADVLVDNSPDTLGVGNVSNLANKVGGPGPEQTSGDDFQLAQGVEVTGASIFSHSDGGSAGDTATLLIYQLENGVPGPIVLAHTGSIEVDNDGTLSKPLLNRKSLTLPAPVTLPAGDYVFSLHGELEIFQGVSDYDDNTIYWGDGANPDLNLGTWTGLGDVLFQLHGNLGVSAWSDQGSALAGVSGDPMLVGTGDLTGGSNNVLNLSNASPNSPSWLVVGSNDGNLPLFGGTLVPFPVIGNPIQLVTSPTGTQSLPFAMPAGPPAGVEIWAQWLVFDPAAVQSIAMSNAVLGVTP